MLSDRVTLFFDHLRRRLGPGGFLRFANDLMNQDHVDQAGLRAAVLQHLGA